MKRIKLVLAATAAMTMMLSLSAGSAGADTCFNEVALAEGKPGTSVSDIASGAAGPGEPGSGTDELARATLPAATLVANAVCP